MKIARVKTQGVRGVADRTFDFTDPSTGAPLDFVVVTGPGGSGKTSLLDAIAAAKEDVAPYGPRRSSAPYVRRGARAAKIVIDWWLSESERARFGVDRAEIASESILAPDVPPSDGHDPRLVALLSDYDHSPEIGKIEYFHEHRTIARGATGSSALAPSDQRGLRLGKDLFKYAVLPRYVLELCLDGGVGQQAFAERFAALCRTKRLGGVRKTYAGREPYFVGEDGAETDVASLSSSEQQALLFAATFLFIGLSGSVVLVDTPELHLASAAVVPFALALRGLGRDNQLVLATGASELVASASPASIIRLGT